MLTKLETILKKNSNKEKANILQRFFKTGKGQYGEGDIFLGITVPQQRQIAKQFKELNFDQLQKLLNTKIHEKRLIALLILIEKYKKSKDKKQIVDFYLSNTKNINNWDLVDLTAHKIVGDFLLDKNRILLHKLSNSKDLWEKRISIISTFAFIRKDQFDDSIKISKNLLTDKHDLIHKAVGWALREIGKKDLSLLKNFLKQNYNNLSRTTLRYAIERFPEPERKRFLKGEF